MWSATIRPLATSFPITYKPRPNSVRPSCTSSWGFGQQGMMEEGILAAQVQGKGQGEGSLMASVAAYGEGDWEQVLVAPAAPCGRRAAQPGGLASFLGRH